MTVAVPASLPACGSMLSASVAVAVSVPGSGPANGAVTSSVALAPEASAPTIHVVPLTLPAEGVPGVSVPSVAFVLRSTAALTLASGPVLVRVTVNAASSPLATGVGGSMLTARSA